MVFAFQSFIISKNGVNNRKMKKIAKKKKKNEQLNIDFLLKKLKN